jgi:hypothetical protein
MVTDRAEGKQGHSPHGFNEDREKGSDKVEVFCLRKNETK